MGEPLAPRPLGPRWRLERDDAVGLTLRGSTEGEGRRLVGLALVGLASASAAWGLVEATPAELELATWPVAGLLALVALLSVPAGVRAVRRLRSGLCLELLETTLTGTPVAGGLLGLPPASVPASEAQSVLLHRREAGALELWSLEVLLASGQRLEGPLVAVPAGEPGPLGAVAARLAARLGCQVQS
jgi:hypothetical protein